MLLRKPLSLLMQLLLKIKYGKRLVLKSLRQTIRADTDMEIAKDARITIGHARFRANVHLSCVHGEMVLGKGVSFNRNCIIACRQKVSIGDGCLFGPNVCVYDHDHVFTVNGIIPDEYKCSEVIIEEGCWIGAGAVILRGTHIGRNSVIGAGAVVKGNVPANSLVTSARENRIIPVSLLKKDVEAACTMETPDF